MNSMDANLLERQRRLELDAYNGAQERLTKQLHRHPLVGHLAADIYQQWIAQLASAIKSEKVSVREGKAKLSKEAVFLLCLDHEEFAFITLHTIVKALADKADPGVTAVAKAIGQACYSQWRYDKKHDRAPNVYDLLLARNAADPSNARSRARKIAQRLEGDWSADQSDAYLGTKLIDLTIRNTSLIQIEKDASREKDGPKTVSVIVLTESAERWLDQRRSHYIELARPLYRPMIVPPIPWSGPTGGGYLTGGESDLPHSDLVKHYSDSARTSALRQADLGTVYEAVNALQETRWRINSRVYQVMLEAWDKGIPLPDLPAGRPSDGMVPSTGQMGEAIQPQANKKRLRLEKRKRIQELLKQRVRLDICADFSRETAFYFPYQLDFRGRATPMTAILHPQSDDLSRALLEFADGKPLGPEGADWLAIHLANCYGIDKVSFRHRREWIKENEEGICSFVKDPLKIDHPFWDTQVVEAPWRLLAACIEWVGYLTNGPTYESHLAITLDGRCNGLQHLSALGRDPRGGLYTNLIPRSDPQDLYQQVADIVVGKIKRDAADNSCADNETARRWDGEIKRSLVKPATMTFSYGVTFEGMREQLLELLEEDSSFRKVQERIDAETQKRLTPSAITLDVLDKPELPNSGERSHVDNPDEVPDYFDDDYRHNDSEEISDDKILLPAEKPSEEQQFFIGWKVRRETVSYMAGILHDSIKEVVIKAVEIRDWLTEVTKVIINNHEDSTGRGRICWDSPTGFPVVQVCWREKKNRIRTVCGYLTVYEIQEKEVPDLRKHCNSITANLVQSLDAAHMMLTIARLHRAGLRHFVEIHDSFGVHACDVDQLRTALREEFVTIYRKPVLDRFLDGWSKDVHLALLLPRPPSPGSLDINQVLQSDYFFA